MRVFISTGEASGDAYGAALATRLMERADVQIEGSGGTQMRLAGVEIVADSSRWGAISIVQALRLVPRIGRGYFRIKRALGQGSPGIFIPIDFGWANIRLCRHAKARGWRILYFIPPGSWRRDKQGGDLPSVTDAIVTPFPWSAEILLAMGATAHWFGHPIKELLGSSAGSGAARDAIAVLPGSRRHELDANLPMIAEAVQGLGRLEFALAPSADAGAVEAQWAAMTGRSGDAFVVGATVEALRRARAAIVCSGTATLEAALCRCPMVVVYRLSRSMALEVRLLRLKRPRFVALPNILLDRLAVPEHVHEDADPVEVRRSLDALLTDSRERSGQLSAFEELDSLLGPADAISRTADLVASWVSA